MSEQVYGLHAVAALLNNPYRRTQTLYVSEERLDLRVQGMLESSVKHDIPIERLTSSVMSQRFPDCVHQGIVAVARALAEYTEREIPSLLELAKQPCLILILDGITEPHNLGACLGATL